jgi:hypothetical protein
MNLCDRFKFPDSHIIKNPCEREGRANAPKTRVKSSYATTRTEDDIEMGMMTKDRFGLCEATMRRMVLGRKSLLVTFNTEILRLPRQVEIKRRKYLREKDLKFIR